MYHSDVSRTSKRRMLCLLGAGVILSNPVVGFVDLLPNALGYLLLCFGLGRLADLEGHICEAVKRFKLLALLGVAQLLAVYFGYGVLRTQATNLYELRSYIVLCSFVFLAVQWFLLVPAMSQLFLGADYLASRYGAEKVGATNRRGKNPIERLGAKTKVFIVFSSLMSFLPEISALSSLKGVGANGDPVFGDKWYGNLTTPEGFDWYRFITLLRTVCGFAALVAAVIWLIALLRFFKKLNREENWLSSLEEKYVGEVLPQTGMLTVRRFTLAFLVLQAAVVFSAQLQINHRGALPSLMLGVLAVCAAWILQKDARPSKLFWICALLLTVVSGVQTVLTASYLSRFEPKASMYQSEAYYAYLTVRGFEVAEAILAFLMLCAVLHYLFQIADKHTGTGVGEEDHLSAKAAQAFMKQLRKRITVLVMVFAAATVLSCAEIVLRLSFQWLWFFSFAMFFAGIWLFSSLLHELKEQIEFRYHSDGVNKNI